VTTNTFENSAAAQLVGSVISLGLLSNIPKLQAISLQVAFAANRMAVAAAQVTPKSYAACMGAGPVGSTSLLSALNEVPIQSGPFGVPPNAYSATTPLPLPATGQNVLCATMNAVRTPMDTNVFFQAMANVANAVSKAVIVTNAPVASRQLLCNAFGAISTFVDTTTSPATGINLLTIGNGCVAVGAACGGSLPTWAATQPLLDSSASGVHALGPGSATYSVCNVFAG
jgi:hypothetical protein